MIVTVTSSSPSYWHLCHVAKLHQLLSCSYVWQTAVMTATLAGGLRADGVVNQQHIIYSYFILSICDCGIPRWWDWTPECRTSTFKYDQRWETNGGWLWRDGVLCPWRGAVSLTQPQLMYHCDVWAGRRRFFAFEGPITLSSRVKFWRSVSRRWSVTLSCINSVSRDKMFCFCLWPIIFAFQWTKPWILNSYKTCDSHCHWLNFMKNSNTCRF